MRDRTDKTKDGVWRAAARAVALLAALIAGTAAGCAGAPRETPEAVPTATVTITGLPGEFDGWYVAAFTVIEMMRGPQWIDVALLEDGPVPISGSAVTVRVRAVPPAFFTGDGTYSACQLVLAPSAEGTTAARLVSYGATAFTAGRLTLAFSEGIKMY